MTKTDSENGRLELENANDRCIISEYPNEKMKSELHNHNPSSARYCKSVNLVKHIFWHSADCR